MAEWLAHPTAVCEDLGSNLTAADGCVYRDGHCDTQPWARAARIFKSALHPSGVAKSSTSFGWGKGGNVTSAGWQVTLCDLIWHASSRSGVAMLHYELLYPLSLPTFSPKLSSHHCPRCPAPTADTIRQIPTSKVRHQ